MNIRKLLEQELNEKKLLVTKRENNVKMVSREVVKANDVIHQLQEQNRKENGKTKLGVQIIQEQEKRLQDKETELESTRKQLKEKTEEFNGKMDEVRNLEQHLEEFRNTNDDLSKKLNTNENVIQWLNKQLTTAQARYPDLRLGPPPEGIYFSPRAMASTSNNVIDSWMV